LGNLREKVGGGERLESYGLSWLLMVIRQLSAVFEVV